MRSMRRKDEEEAERKDRRAAMVRGRRWSRRSRQLWERRWSCRARRGAARQRGRLRTCSGCACTSRRGSEDPQHWSAPTSALRDTKKTRPLAEGLVQDLEYVFVPRRPGIDEEASVLWVLRHELDETGASFFLQK